MALVIKGLYNFSHNLAFICFFYFNTFHFLIVFYIGSLLGTARSEFSGSISSIPSRVSMSSLSGDSSFEKNQLLERRSRVWSFIQMNIEEISIVQVQVQAKDVLKDILVTNLLVDEICQEVAGGLALSYQGVLRC